MKNLFDLKNKTVVVTGGAGALGQAFCEGLASHGAHVYLADIAKKAARTAAVKFKAKGLDVRPIHIDITKISSIKKTVESILKAEKKIDVWVNNAYPRTRDWGLKFEAVKSSSWKKNVDSHLNGYCFCCQQVAEQMKKQKNGVIINVASIYGMQGPDFSIYDDTDMTMPAAYSAIKGGIINFTKYLASYYGRYGVRVNAVSPGGILNGQPKKFVERYSKKTLLGRMADSEDIVGTVVYLSSKASSYMTGQNLVVDGGLTVC